MLKIKGYFFIFIIIASSVTISYGDTYRIGPGDILEISVWRDQNLSRDVVVPPDCIISFPLIGDVDATNMSVPELRKKLSERLLEYLPDVSVTVMFKQINSLNAYVIGKVRSPGVFPITMETSVMQILSMAGGLTPFAAERNIHILRQKKNNIEKIDFDYKMILKGKDLRQNILLKPGDVIVVP
ncbi:MAG: polysaccharide biosynthesis/export family protein [Proteobacteria bacterium]|nr:polysaccharide biosynthesis/export family protein [Pseudomonadota bacterium]